MNKYRVDIITKDMQLRYGYNTYQEAKDFAMNYAQENKEADIFILEFIECISRYDVMEMIRG